MKISENTRSWIHGLLSAFIGSSSAALAAIFVAPQTFNIYTLAGWGHIGVMGLVAGMASVVTYLKQSPLPPMTTLNLSQTTDPSTGAKTTTASVTAPSETGESK